VIEDVLRRLDVYDFLRLDFGNDINCEVQISIFVPQVRQIVQAFFEEGRLQVLEEVHTLKVCDCCVRDADWRFAIWGSASCNVGHTRLATRQSEGL